ncbi:hypothetical protein [Actinoplanes sp. GCM10030250]|uniref:hypothetical protein n=1 Tax=Actinoplanes sp. GCM10030250 TaxID=3273376 RepID=UPI003614B989
MDDKAVLADVIQAGQNLRSGIENLLRGRQSLNAYLASLSLPLAEPPPMEVRCYAQRRFANSPVARSDCQPRPSSFPEDFAWILPESTGSEEHVPHSSPIEEAVAYCQVLAGLASALIIVANVTSGSVSLAIQKVARDLRQPLVNTGVEVALAAAKALNDGKAPAEVAGKLASAKILETIPGEFAPGAIELKATAFVLRLTGVLICLAANERLQFCPCFPDFLSDIGAGLIDHAAGEDGL